MLTKGDIPPKVSGCCALIHENNLYTFGGKLCKIQIELQVLIKGI